MSRFTTWKVVALVAVATAALVGAGPALAQDTGLDVANTMAGAGVMLSNPESVEKETTFGLMENEGDFIWEPAELGALQGWKRDRTIGNKWDSAAKWDGGWFLVSNLGNTVTQDAYQLGTWGKLGPGNLAVIVSFQQDKEDYQSSSSHLWGMPSSYTRDGVITFETTSAPYTNTTNETAFGPTFDQSEMGSNSHKGDWSSQDLYVAYGLPIGDHMWLGGSWRHGNAKNTYDTSSSSSSDTLDTSSHYTYEVIENTPTVYHYTETWDEVVDYTRHEDSTYTASESGDLTTDLLAVEFKMRPTDNMSFKVRGTYNMIGQDMKGSYQNDELVSESWPAQEGTQPPYDFPYAITETEVYGQTSKSLTDMSIDGNEWGLAAKFNWYRGAGGLQVDVGYTSGDFDFNSSIPEQSTMDGTDTYNWSYLESGSLNGTDETLGPYVIAESLTGSMTWDGVGTGRSQASLTGKDLSRSALLIGAKYLWVWDKVDFLMGLRYWENKADASFSWANTSGQSSEVDATGYDYPNENYAASITYLPPNTEFNDSVAYTYEDTFHGTMTQTAGKSTYATTGSIKYGAVELPLAVIFHVTDKFALRFGVQHSFRSSEWSVSTDNLSNGYSYTSDYTFASHEDNNGTVTDHSEVGTYGEVDAVSNNHHSASAKSKYDDSVTAYRIGAEYKFNDHVTADLMASETSGGDNDRENVALKYIVAGVSIRF